MFIDDLYPVKRLSHDATKEEMNQIKGNKFEVDLHELYVEEAIMHLRNLVKNAPKHITQISVIHGYNSGQALKGALTVKNLRSKRVAKIHPMINKGQSLIVFKDQD